MSDNQEPSIFEAVSRLMEEHEVEIDAMLARWTNDMLDADFARKSRALIRQPPLLRVYISITDLRNKTFSLRFFGQKVASIVYRPDPMLLVDRTQRRRNMEWFAKYDRGIDVFGESPDPYPWNGFEASQFKRVFRQIASREKDIRTRFPEHVVESEYIKNMESTPRPLFHKDIGEIQPVRIAKCPLQVPFPLSASGGKPCFNRSRVAHADILARRRPRSGRERLSVWELKQPRKLDHAADQAYIYALTLRHVLRRSRYRQEFYKACGFESHIPAKLNIEAIVAVSQDQEQKFMKQFERLIQDEANRFTIDSDRIMLFLALYEEKDFKMVDFKQLK